MTARWLSKSVGLTLFSLAGFARLRLWLFGWGSSARCPLGNGLLPKRARVPPESRDSGRAATGTLLALATAMSRSKVLWWCLVLGASTACASTPPQAPRVANVSVAPEKAEKASTAEASFTCSYNTCTATRVTPEVVRKLEAFFSDREHVKLNLIPATAEDLASVREIPWLTRLHVLVHLSGSNVTDLEPLRALPSLRELSISDRRNLRSLAPLASATHLEFLMVIGSNIDDIQGLSGLPELRSVMITETPLTSIAPLAACPKLSIVDVAGTAVATIAPLSKNTRIYSLNINKTQVTDLRSISTMKGLHDLRISGLGVQDLAPLSTLTELQMVDVSSNPLTSLAPLRGLTNLTAVEANGTAVTDVSPLARTNLHRLEIAGTPVRDLTSLEKSKLDHLVVSTTMPKAALDKLKAAKPGIEIEYAP